MKRKKEEKSEGEKEAETITVDAATTTTTTATAVQEYVTDAPPESPIKEWLIFGVYYFQPMGEGIVYPMHCQTCSKTVDKGYRVRANVINSKTDEMTHEETILCQRCFEKLCERWLTRTVEDIRDSIKHKGDL